VSESDILTVGVAVSFVLLLLWSSASWSRSLPRNLYDQQRSNRRWSYFLIAVFALFVGSLGFGLDLFVFRMPFPPLGLNIPEASRFPYGTKLYWEAVEASKAFGVPWGTIAAVSASLLMAHFSYRYTPAVVLGAAHARQPNLDDPKEAQLLNVVQEMATAAGLPAPRVHIVPDPDPNAFATGTGPEHAHVAVTQGLLEGLNREELQGVVAHELSHIRNGDMELMTLVVALAGAAALIADWARRGMRMGRAGPSGASRDKGKSGAAQAVMFFAWILFVLLAPLISRLMALAVSRRREYLADASGSELTRNPLSLAKALEKIHQAAAPTQSMSAEGFAHLCIEDPKGSAFDAWEGFLGELLSTHPPIHKRIQALQEMAYLYAPRQV